MVSRASSRFLELVGRGLSDADLVAHEARALGSVLGHTAEVHRWARGHLERSFSRVMGRKGTLEEIQSLQSLAAHDGQYGRGWPDKPSPITGYQTSMSQCNNWGAIQCKCKPVDGQCCEGCGYWYDSTPTAQGQRYFEQCFRCYPTPEDGAADLVQFLKNGYPAVMAALPSGNLDEIAWQMRLGNYFHGFTTDKRDAARQYAEAMRKQAVAIAAAMGEEQVADRKGEGLGAFSPASLTPGRAALLGLAAGAVGVLVLTPGALLVPLVALGAVVDKGARRIGL